MIPNPRFPGAAARMTDGRLFTDYRPNCMLVPQNTAKLWTEYDRHTMIQKTGAFTVAADRAMAAQRSGPVAGSCVDTMVPELQKRVYHWNGPVQTGVAQAAGIGTGRLYLPGQPGLAQADPDLIAAATFPSMPGTFDPQGIPSYASVGSAPVTAGRAHNRYSAPYGNQ